MRGTSIKCLVNDDGVIEEARVERYINDEKVSKYKIKVGSELIVKPLNKQKKKHRDRRVKVIKFINDQARYGDLRASVLFLDNNRRGIVEVSDLDTFE